MPQIIRLIEVQAMEALKPTQIINFENVLNGIWTGDSPSSDHDDRDRIWSNLRPIPDFSWRHIERPAPSSTFGCAILPAPADLSPRSTVPNFLPYVSSTAHLIGAQTVRHSRKNQSCFFGTSRKEMTINRKQIKSQGSEPLFFTQEVSLWAGLSSLETSDIASCETATFPLQTVCWNNGWLLLPCTSICMLRIRRRDAIVVIWFFFTSVYFRHDGTGGT